MPQSRQSSGYVRGPEPWYACVWDCHSMIPYSLCRDSRCSFGTSPPALRRQGQPWSPSAFGSACSGRWNDCGRIHGTFLSHPRMRGGKAWRHGARERLGSRARWFADPGDLRYPPAVLVQPQLRWLHLALLGLLLVSGRQRDTLVTPGGTIGSGAIASVVVLRGVALVARSTPRSTLPRYLVRP